jgi:hypothetical protein
MLDQPLMYGGGQYVAAQGQTDAFDTNGKPLLQLPRAWSPSAHLPTSGRNALDADHIKVLSRTPSLHPSQQLLLFPIVTVTV